MQRCSRAQNHGKKHGRTVDQQIEARTWRPASEIKRTHQSRTALFPRDHSRGLEAGGATCIGIARRDCPVSYSYYVQHARYTLSPSPFPTMHL